jgi:CHAD domain-containing protein
MKARKVKHLDPDGPLTENVARIVAVRLDELCGFMPQAADPAEVVALHDLRIAAKRLRYVLEPFAPSFGPYAATAARRARKLQDLVGEIHDCDVTLPRVAALLAEDPDPDVAHGLRALDAHLRARRAERFAQFLERWAELEHEGFRPRLEEALDHQAITSRSHDGNGREPMHDLASDAPA